MTSGWTIKGIRYLLLPRTYNPQEVFDFNVAKGTSPLNFGNGAPSVREHMGRIVNGQTLIWGAFDGDKLVGMITGECNGGYWNNAVKSKGLTCFINEFVVDPDYRGKNIGGNLCKMTIDPVHGVWPQMPNVIAMYTTVHEDNIGSYTAFVKGGYTETITYADALRKRNTTVLHAPKP